MMSETCGFACQSRLANWKKSRALMLLKHRPTRVRPGVHFDSPFILLCLLYSVEAG